MSEQLYRPGLEGVIAGETAISTIENGLRYRGYGVEDLADNATFDETAYLLLHGELPDTERLAAFQERIAAAAKLNDAIMATLRSIPATVSMMDIMRSGSSLLAHWEPEAGDNSHNANVRKAERLLAQLPIVLGAAHRIREGLQPVEWNPNLSFAANVLWLINGEEPSRKITRAMDASLVIYAEDELNASAFASRVVCSTRSDIHSSVTAAIGALKGPLHGGANEAVMDVLADVGSAGNAKAWVQEALANKIKIMGFGHRVYKTGDPRAKYLKPICTALAADVGRQDLEQMADTIEEIVGKNKGLPANVDWPSARLYYYMGLPVHVYTPLFVVSRVTGWSAHVIEQLDNNRIIRPLAKYTGKPARKVIQLANRC